MKTLITFLFIALLAGCTSIQYIPVPKNVYVWVPIPSELMVTCPGATWEKGITWRQMAVNGKKDQAANQAYAVYMQSIKSLISTAPPVPVTGARPSFATAHVKALPRIDPKISQLCVPLK